MKGARFFDFRPPTYVIFHALFQNWPATINQEWFLFPQTGQKGFRIFDFKRLSA